MLRRDRRRQRKRSAQAINGKRQGALCVTWAAIALALIALMVKVAGAGTIVPLAVFIVSFTTGIAGLAYAHVMWKREQGVLEAIGAPSTVPATIKQPKIFKHRPETTHRAAAPQRGASRVVRN